VPNETWSHFMAEEWLAEQRRRAGPRPSVRRGRVHTSRRGTAAVFPALATAWGAALTAGLTLGGLATSVVVLLIALGLLR